MKIQLLVIHFLPPSRDLFHGYSVKRQGDDPTLGQRLPSRRGLPKHYMHLNTHLTDGTLGFGFDDLEIGVLFFSCGFVCLSVYRCTRCSGQVVVPFVENSVGWSSSLGRPQFWRRG